jgi:cytoskeletal protein CcmA (bactofilin family)
MTLIGNLIVTNGISSSGGITGSYTGIPGLVSGSSQVISSLPSGIVSGSSQLPSGIVSGSSQLPSGIVSGSSQLPSGIISGSSQLNNATIANLTITNLTTINQTSSVFFTSGSTTHGDFGNDIHGFTGSVQISGSLNIIGGITGSIAATNGVVSGSSQIDVISTTNIARLATTGSNTFIGNQTITGNISLGASNTSYVGPAQYGGVMFPRGQIVFSNTNSQNQMYIVSNAYLNAGGSWAYRTASQYAGYMAIDNGMFSVGLAGNSGAADSTVTFTNPISITNAGVTTFAGNVLPEATGTRDLGSSSYRWSTVYTSDLSLNNGIGDWTIVEGEDDLFLYNNKKGKVYKFALTEVDPNVATPKKS